MEPTTGIHLTHEPVQVVFPPHVTDAIILLCLAGLVALIGTTLRK
jgi:hypothetical protein